MPLGKQFQNTFHTDERGNIIFHTDSADIPGQTPDEHGAVDGAKELHPHQPVTSEKPHQGVSYQGMLFSPHAFTGLKTDPTISEEQRRSTIQTALHLGADEYSKNIKGNFPAKDTARVEQSRMAISDAAHETAIPTHMFKENIDVKAIASTKLGSATGGDFSTRNNMIRTRVRADSERVGEETYMDQRYERGEGFLSNPKHEKDNEKISYALGATGYLWTSLGKIPSEHIFPGRGEDTDEYSTHNIKVHIGYTDKGRRKSAIVHARRPKVAVGEPVERTRGVYEDKLVSSQDTIAHEIGHSMDTTLRIGALRNLNGADTVHEAIADGVSDRFVRHGHDYERTLEPSPERAREIKNEGYGLKNKNVAGTDINKALYAAVRTHVAMGDKNFQDILDRKALYKQAPLPTERRQSANISWDREASHEEQTHHANHLLLGHLYTTHSHVRESLSHLGLAHIGENAANHYRTHITDAGNVPLPGFEHLGYADAPARSEWAKNNEKIMAALESSATEILPVNQRSQPTERKLR